MTTPPRPSPASAAGGGTRLLRLLTFSTLYPNAAQPNHGVFVENRLRHLVAGGAAESTVLAPVPWFPLRTPPRAAVPAREERHGLTVHHPRFVAAPGIGMYANPFALLAVARRALRQLLADGHHFDAIDAHYLYPDGVAAVRLGREFNLPVVITARGSDTSQLPHYAIPGRLIRDAIARADALVAVSADLARGLVALGAPEEKVTVLRNGVDLDLFRPTGDRAALRAELGLAGPTLLSVGLLIERKRHHLTIEALRDLPGHALLIAGEGPERPALQALVERLGLTDRVRLLGAVPHARLPALYAAADVMVLASSREGWANVLLESMACGTPVVATPAWGMQEAVSAPEAGMVLKDATPAAIAAGVRRLLAAPPDRAATRAHAERHGWEETTAGQLALFRQVVGR
ncbi:glycosyltransferase family 4 protein [Paracraurococcus ruber]|uniref:Glycosyl transferase family 1 n=1 Tax=Paracraurococcus ruber TaxID=77675 RepID=A0ABS1CV56_9PROT|nr:glycosyltransferase family 4 protein [Paracraurococcus ruber]MBK1658285.1 glycosyl transferase family 1 [Paracraurococcus ruber]TDG31010.1 glycosyltransferase family 4 protein [Paracraurococcus ruber]